MEIRLNRDTAYVLDAVLDVRLTLMDSAQVFHWTEHEGAFYAVISGRALCVRIEQTGFSIAPCDSETLEFALDYFDLRRDYGALRTACEEWPVVARAMDMLPGLHVLNQDAWEALLAFILSANNNVTRIRRLVMALCEALGERFELDGRVLYGFPSPETLAATPESLLRALGVGYRAPYLIGAARAVAGGFPLNNLHSLPYEEAHAELLKLPGVGDKVADCVLLFGCGHASAFPVDVWVERMMKCWFGMNERGRVRVSARGRALLGAQAGILQQYMFHCARTGLIPLEPGAIPSARGAAAQA